MDCLDKRLLKSQIWSRNLKVLGDTTNVVKIVFQHCDALQMVHLLHRQAARSCVAEALSNLWFHQDVASLTRATGIFQSQHCYGVHQGLRALLLLLERLSSESRRGRQGQAYLAQGAVKHTP